MLKIKVILYIYLFFIVFIFSVSTGSKEKNDTTMWCYIKYVSKNPVVYDCKSSLVITKVLETLSKTNYEILFRADSDVFLFMRSTVLPHTFLFINTFPNISHTSFICTLNAHKYVDVTIWSVSAWVECILKGPLNFQFHPEGKSSKCLNMDSSSVQVNIYSSLLDWSE